MTSNSNDYGNNVLRLAKRALASAPYRDPKQFLIDLIERGEIDSETGWLALACVKVELEQTQGVKGFDKAKKE
jgi:hypothetical protein